MTRLGALLCTDGFHCPGLADPLQQISTSKRRSLCPRALPFTGQSPWLALDAMRACLGPSQAPSLLLLDP